MACVERIGRALGSFALWSWIIVGGAVAPVHAQTANPLPPVLQEQQCIARGWSRSVLEVEGLQRAVLWRTPNTPRPKAAILVFHGGGGRHFQWCVANDPIVAPQVRFSEAALAEGFAVFLLDSSDRITDHQGRVCGKVWDDEVRNRRNLDLPLVQRVMDELVPAAMPLARDRRVFLTGLSSGGYMTVRAASHFNQRVLAFAPVSSGDPYGWNRICDPALSERDSVYGAGFDNETGLQIIVPGACQARRYDREMPWDDGGAEPRPVFRVFSHQMDGINDFSCARKVDWQLRKRGYRHEGMFVLQGGSRNVLNHLWLDAYNEPVLQFFGRHVSRAK